MRTYLIPIAYPFGHLINQKQCSAQHQHIVHIGHQETKRVIALRAYVEDTCVNQVCLVCIEGIHDIPNILPFCKVVHTKNQFESCYHRLPFLSPFWRFMMEKERWESPLCVSCLAKVMYLIWQLPCGYT